MSTCERHKDHPENAQMTPEMALDHFLMCFGHGRQQEVLTTLMEGARQGSACWMANHQGLIQSQAAYTAKLLTGLREIVAEYEGVGVINGSTITARLQELIS